MADLNVNIEKPDISKFELELQRPKTPKPDPVVNAPTRPMDSVAFHDFAFHEYLLPTENENDQISDYQLSTQGLRLIDQLEQAGTSPDGIQWLADLMIDIESSIISAVLVWYLAPDFTLGSQPMLESIFNDLYSENARYIVLLLQSAKTYLSFAQFEGNRLQFKNAVFDAMQNILARSQGRLFQLWPAFFITELERRLQILHDTLGPDVYPFEVFRKSSVNVGLRLIYRQEWTPLGVQPGEIVRTIPLGPGEKQKVSTKIVRRRKVTTSLETTIAMESTTESADTTKDSSEIVNETANTHKWSEDLDVNASFLGIGVSSKTNFGGSNEDKSKATSARLSEAVQKTANKIRRESKVVVSTETEETFSREDASEILNPNNEVAITYEYYRLQQQYQVFTYLAEVEGVIFVAEDLPSPAEVNEHWVRRHDWIIAKVLKDESHRATLNELIQEVDEPDIAGDKLAVMADAAHSQFAKFDQSGNQGNPQNQGLSIPDIYSEPQRAYAQYLKDKSSRDRANQVRNMKRNRLFQHLRDNILYYYHAIWTSEDPDQRILRYKKENRQVPIEWNGPALLQLTGGAVPGLPPAPFTPTGKTAPLWELIDPTGPLGYNGNYAVFALRPLPLGNPDGLLAERIRNGHIILSLNDVLSIMQSPYMGPDPRDVDATIILDPALKDYVAHANDTLNQQADLLNAPEDGVVADILSYVPKLRLLLIKPEFLVDGQQIFNGDGSLLPDRVWKDANDPNGKNLQNPISPDDYAQYLWRRNGTRRFLVDSNNLYLGIRTGEGAALEPFKRAHRYIDVLKAREELLALQYKNLRRDMNIDQPTLYDPDIEKVVIVEDGSGSSIARGIAAVEAGRVGTSRRSGSSPTLDGMQPVPAGVPAALPEGEPS